MSLSISSNIQSAMNRFSALTLSFRKPPAGPTQTGPTHRTDHVENCRARATTVKPPLDGKPPAPVNNPLLGRVAGEVLKTVLIDTVIDAGKALGRMFFPGPTPPPQGGGAEGASGNGSGGSSGSGNSGSGGSSGGGAQGAHG